MLDLTRENRLFEPELREAFERVMRSGQFILGPEVEQFEREAAAFVQVKHAIAVSSGTDAILLALMTLGIGAGDEVVCPSFTFFATAGCVHRVGATPVFADSCPNCFNLHPASLRSKITKRTKAIIPVHLYGQAVAMDSILAIADEARVPVIEDAAQAFGARYRQRPVGSMGAFGVYSFFPTKNLGGFGDGGMLVCHDDALAEKARILRVHGAQPKYFHRYVGANFRMDALQGAMLRVKLPHLVEYNAARRRNASGYERTLGSKSVGNVGACDCEAGKNDSSSIRGESEAEIVLPQAWRDRGHIWNQYTIRVGGGRRDALKTFLENEGIASEIYYPLALHQQECFARADGKVDSLPCAELLAREVLSLPIYPGIAEEQLERVARVIRGFSSDIES